MVSSGSTGTKVVDEKKPSASMADTQPGHWSRTLTEQNPALKQGLQQLVGHMQSSKHSRHPNSVRKEARSIGETRKTTKSMPVSAAKWLNQKINKLINSVDHETISWVSLLLRYYNFYFYSYHSWQFLLICYLCFFWSTIPTSLFIVAARQNNIGWNPGEASCENFFRLSKGCAKFGCSINNDHSQQYDVRRGVGQRRAVWFRFQRQIRRVQSGGNAGVPHEGAGGLGERRKVQRDSNRDVSSSIQDTQGARSSCSSGESTGIRCESTVRAMPSNCIPQNLETHAKLEALTATMTATSKKLEATCATLRKDNESLRQYVSGCCNSANTTQDRDDQ